jgi:hypothetical protein
MEIRRLAWLMGFALAACSTGEAPATSAIQGAAGAALAQPADPAAAVAPAPTGSTPPASAAVLTPADLPTEASAPPLPPDADQLAGPVLPPEVVSAMTYDQYRLTLDSHGPGIVAFETTRGDAVDLILGTASVVDDVAPPADIEVE